MAYVTRREEVCDVCGTVEGLERFRVGRPGGRSKTVALCPGDRGLLERLLGSRARPKRAVPIEEVK